MPTADAFMAAILAAPDDDLPRLVYADWLEEHGQAGRAEFVRVQIELATCEPWVCLGRDKRYRIDPRSYASCGGCRPCVLRDRERELLARNYIQWTMPLPSGFLAQGIDYSDLVFITDLAPSSGAQMQARFRRGFIHAVTLTAADWLAYADALCWHPKQRCSECEGTGSPHVAAGAVRTQFDPPCPACNSTGRRLCPVTAQPIEAVTLTTWPVQERRDHIHGHIHGGHCRKLHGRSWERWYGIDYPGRSWERWYGIDYPDSHSAPHLLRAEWPSVKDWHLPPMRGGE